MDLKEQISIIERGSAEIINVQNLRDKLADGRPLCIKAGFDPTAPDIHLGHVVLLRKLRQFQDLGHKVFFLIGDFTAQIGDPTGRDQLRPKLDKPQIKKNARTYKDQVFKILDPKKTRVVFNSEWLGELSSSEILDLTTHASVAQMLARADFKKRFEDGKEISILEFVYPLLQGYDSVHLKADVELGGTDQKFNLLMGRQMQEIRGQSPQVVLMTPLLEGTDGVQKMSKSLGNYIGINEAPNEIFGKIMSVNDDLMMRYFDILTSADLKKVQTMHPKEAKLLLGQLIVTQFYDEATAQKARDNFERTFSRKQTPDDVLECRIKDLRGKTIMDLLLELNLVESKNEFRRLLKQGAISLGGAKVDQENQELRPGLLKVGKRRFLKLI